ncbi:MAG: gliding motility-associated C-terminal domain-containing protein [Chitinophagaceae bacterium]|nr:gliding motility-associated C-terminal domain-containing protein [Chitinophagaceae bacterium]
MPKLFLSTLLFFLLQLCCAQPFIANEFTINDPAATAEGSNDQLTEKPLSPVNDEPCSAIILPINSVCNYRTFDNTGSTASNAVPAPGCASYSGSDVWFRIKVPNAGTLVFDMQAGSMTDAGMAIYKGPDCNSLTLVACDDNSSSNPSMPMINAAGLTPNTVIWIRVWGTGNNNGTFGICASLPLNVPPCAGNNLAGNTCALATAVCNFNGYCGNTSNRYTSDTWQELSDAFRNCIGTGATIENNSFISFIAAGTTAEFNVWITSSTSGNGIQMMFYEGGCGSGPVTCHGGYNNVTGGPNLVTASGLTPGNQYFLMIDGVGSDVCDYTINPASGVDLLDINPEPAKICSGGNIQLTAIGGNGIYAWSPATGLSSTSGATVTASPSLTTVYTVASTGDGNCPAVLTKQITVSVTPPAVSTTTVNICSSQLPYTWNGRSISSAGTFTDTIATAAGCDSVLKLVLTLKPNSSSTSIIGACPAQLPFRWNGNNYNSSGTYQAILLNSAGCDSIAVLNFTVGQYSASTQNISICPSQLPYRWNSHSINAAGTYADTIPGSSGCDSISTLILTVKATSSGTTSITICNSQLPFLWNGNSYNNSGNYQATFVNTAGCDSVALLQLTVLTASGSTQTVNICRAQLPYSWNGNNYNTAGTYQASFTNAAGCDSVAKLILNVNEPGSSINHKQLCPGQLPVTINGQLYTAEGTYIDTLVNAAGCDSVVTLILSVKDAPAVSLGGDTSLCPRDSISLFAGNYAQYLWQDGSTASSYKVKEQGTYSVTVTDADGCTGSGSIDVTYLATCLDISFPTAIAPNGNGGNADFGALGNLALVSNYSLSIFNRHGLLVFRTSNPYQRWNGFYKNKAFGNESFAWVAEYVFKGKLKKIQKGSLVVVR